jgi:acyl-CoA thioesterase FadM
VVAVHLLLRTLLTILFASRKPPLAVHDISRKRMRVLPTDLDLQNHVNNGVYLSLMDLGRFDLLIRSGIWPTMRARGIYPVVACETISFRKSLRPWQSYTIESGIAGYDDRAVYIQQRFVVDGEIYAQAFLSGRFLWKTGGVVGMAELGDILGVDVTQKTPPAWVERWAADVALPSTRADAPSVWP